MRISDWSSDVCSSDLFKRDVIMWIVTGFVRPCSPATKRLSAWRGKSTGSKVPLSLARKRNSSGATWRLMNKNLHYVAEHTSAASNSSEEHTSELQSLMRTSYAVFCLKKKNKNRTINPKRNKRMPTPH